MNFKQKQNNQHQSNNQSGATKAKQSSNQIVMMAQPTPIQQRQNCKIAPSLIGQPLIPIDMSAKITSYTQINKDIIEEVKSKQKPNQLSIDDIYKASKDKCDLHTIKLSVKCRKCKQILFNLQTQQAIQKASAMPMVIDNQSMGVVTQLQYQEEDSSFKNGKQSITGNLNPLILNNILSCQYFKEVLVNRKFNEVIDEIVANVNNIEAWAVGISGVPSTFFCCLYRFVLLALDDKQIALLTRAKCVYVTIAGLLYIRYLSNPNELWRLLSPYLEDETLFYPTVDQKNKLSIGNYVINLFKDYNHYGTRLPRIPTQIEREIKMKLVMKEESTLRKKSNEKAIREMIKGSKCKIYKDIDQNMTVNEVIGKYCSYNEKSNKVIVNVNKEELIVGLGDIEFIESKNDDKLIFDNNDLNYDKDDMKKSNRSRSKSRSWSKRRKKSRSRSKEKKYNGHRHSHYSHRDEYHHYKKHNYYQRERESYRSRDHSYKRSHSKTPDTNHNKALKKIIEDEKNSAIAKGRDYAVKPTSFKKSISIKVPGIIKKSSRSSSPLKQNIEILQMPKQQSTITTDKEEPVVYSKEFLERQKQLKKQYQDNTLPKGSYPKKGSDYVGPEIMKLG